MIKPKVCILKTDGINCDMEMSYAFELAGGTPELVHVNQLRNGQRRLTNYEILAIPGGFSYGDDIASGKVLANELTTFFSEQLQEFASKKKPILGVCNGFQVLVRTGLLPDSKIGKQTVTLAENEIGRFECRWINLNVAKNVCKFVRAEDFNELPIPIQIAHGEGNFYTDKATISKLQSNGQIVFRYANNDLSANVSYPDNPNGSLDNIAGICDPTGLILGMMPHPERSIGSYHPDRLKTETSKKSAMAIFSNIIKYAKEN